MVVSVIVPVYNVAPYLRECVESIRTQTYSKLEILLIDDQSTDDSGSICDELAAADSRIQVIHKPNEGAGYARNTGIDHSSGAYLAFVDGDDRLHPRAMEKLLDAAVRQEADITLCNYVRFYPDGQETPAVRMGFTPETNLDTVNFRFEAFFSKGHFAYVWGKLYRREFLIHSGVRLNNQIYAEDKLFNMKCYLHKPRCAFIEENLYGYRCNTDSVSHRYKKNYAGLWIDTCAELSGYMHAHEIDEKKYFDLIGCSLVLAAFFSAKQEFESSEKTMTMTASVAVIRDELKKYNRSSLMQRTVRCFSKGNYVGKIRSVVWKGILWGFCVIYRMKWVDFIALGICFMLKWQIDTKFFAPVKNGGKAKE